jgi:hypothetical protein
MTWSGCRLMAALFSAACVTVLSSCSQTVEPPIAGTRVEFRGWKGAYRLCGGKGEAIIVPAIGRMMCYRLKDGENVLDVNPRWAGFVPPSNGRDPYRYFGGLYTWIAPQSRWIPYDGKTTFTGADPVLDNGPYQVTAATEDELTMVSPVSTAYGLQMTKHFKLWGNNARLEYTVSLRNTGNVPVRWAVWNLTGVRPAGVVFFTVPRGINDLQLVSDSRPNARRYGRAVHILPGPTAAVDYRKYQARGGKIYVRVGSDYLAYRQPGSWFLRRFKSSPSELYTDWQSQIELWAEASVRSGRIFEIEVTSPDFVILPGQSVSWSESMAIIPDSPKIGDYATEAGKIPAVLARGFPDLEPEDLPDEPVERPATTTQPWGRP